MRQSIPPASPATLEDLYAEHAERVRTLMWLFGVADPDRDDATQEVWLVVHRSLKTFDPQRGSRRAWLAGIARRVAHDWRRTRRRRPEFSTHTEEEPTTVQTPEVDLANTEIREALWSYCARVLPEEQREAFFLFEIHELMIEEIAAITGARANTVKWRIGMARRRLKEEMTEEERTKLRAILPVMSVDALIQAMRDVEFPEGENDRVWDRVRQQIEAEGGSIHDRLGSPSTPPAAAPTPPSGYSLAGSRLTGALAAMFVLGALSGGGIVFTVVSSPTRSTVSARMEAELPTPPERPQEPRPEPTGADTASPSATSSARPAPSLTAAAQEETALLNRARGAKPTEALALAEQHARQFPNSKLAAGREEIAIRALVRLGRHVEAEQRAANLVQLAPSKRPAMESLLGRSFL